MFSNDEEKEKLTSIKLLNDVYKKFKQKSVDENFTLQKLVNRSLYKYVKDNSYKDEIENFTELQELSGSKW